MAGETVLPAMFFCATLLRASRFNIRTPNSLRWPTFFIIFTFVKPLSVHGYEVCCGCVFFDDGRFVFV